MNSDIKYVLFKKTLKSVCLVTDNVKSLLSRLLRGYFLIQPFTSYVM